MKKKERKDIISDDPGCLASGRIDRRRRSDVAGVVAHRKRRRSTAAAVAAAAPPIRRKPEIEKRKETVCVFSGWAPPRSVEPSPDSSPLRVAAVAGEGGCRRCPAVQWSQEASLVLILEDWFWFWKTKKTTHLNWVCSWVGFSPGRPDLFAKAHLPG